MGGGYGSGGVTVEEPSRTYPVTGTVVTPPDLSGGARGPAALPSRTVVRTHPAPPDPRALTGGAHGPVAQHRGAFVEDAGAPRLLSTGELYHSSLPWHRPVYANMAGRVGYHAPTQMPSWSANAAVAAGLPQSPIPVSNKRIANGMVRETFGATRQLFPGTSLAGFVGRLQNGWALQGRRWLAQAKTTSPRPNSLTRYGPAGSYGQTTTTLPTAPTNRPAGTTGGLGGAY